MIKNKTLLYSILGCCIPYVLGVIYYNRMPDEMPIHWNFDGVPDNFASKNWALFFFPTILIFGLLFLHFTISTDSKNKNNSRQAKTIPYVVFPILCNGLTIMMIYYSLGNQNNIMQVIFIILGICFILMGNYMPKFKQSQTIGIRLSWTLNDPNNWYKTHRFAGIVWVIAGIMMVGCGIFNLKYIVIAILVFASLLPFIYSYITYKKTLKEEL